MQWGGKEWADNKEGNRRNVQGSNESVTLQHPIVYETYNICEIVDQSKLAKFSIQTLKDICAALELDVASMTWQVQAALYGNYWRRFGQV